MEQSKLTGIMEGLTGIVEGLEDLKASMVKFELLMFEEPYLTMVEVRAKSLLNTEQLEWLISQIKEVSLDVRS